MVDRGKRAVRSALAAGLKRKGYSEEMVAEAEAVARSALAARRRSLSARHARVFAGSAVVWPASGRARLVPIEAPFPGPDEVAVEILASCVSPGTERAHYLRLPNARPELPFTPGYSAAGRALAVGAEVRQLAVGDLVAVPRARHASVATVPAADALAVPAGVTVAEASFVYLAIIAGYGITCGALEPGEDVCIVGAGPIGAAAQRLARLRGAGSTTVVATSRQREAIARAGQADRFLALDEDREIEALSVPLVVDATGHPDAVNVAISAAAPSGRVVLLGSPRGTTAALPVAELRRRHLTLLGAHISTIIRRGREQQRDLMRTEAETFLAGLADRRISVTDLVGVPVDPRESDVFYRRLAQTGLVGAYFDWSTLPQEERASARLIWTRPDTAARGLTYGRAPLPPSRELANHVREQVGNPFRGARGHLRIGLLGCGDIGVANAAAISAAPNAELVACFDNDEWLAREVGARFGGEAADSAEALLGRDDVDAVFLALPHHLHAPLAIAAAEAGLHVIVEKPLANDLASALAIVDAAQRAGVALTTCFPYRYEPAALAARFLFLGGAVGEFAGATVSYRADKPASYWLSGYSNRSASDWRRWRSQAGGGVLVMNLSHYVDLIRHVAGVEVEAVTAAEAPGGDEVEQAISVAITFRNGSIGTLTGDAGSRGGLPTEFHLRGSEGYLTLEPEPLVFPGHATAGLVGARWHALPTTPLPDVRAVFVSRFATALDRGEEPDVGPGDALAVQALVEAAYESSRRGETVRPADLLERSLV